MTVEIPEFARRPASGLITPAEVLEAKKRKLALLEQRVALTEDLPHLYGQKMYEWQRWFFENRAHMLFLTAANQVGKSSIQIRKCIEWCTNSDLWSELFPEGLHTKLAWYLYPSKDVATYEWETKWKPLMPKGQYKDHPRYGWQEIKANKRIEGVRFNSGFLLLFKAYAQKADNLQTGTCAFVMCDEELPIALYHELTMRINAQNGYFSMVFTATLGQNEWRLTMEPEDNEEEMFPAAAKRQVSLFECVAFEDGSPSHWTEQRIQIAIQKCATESEVQRRIYGKFVTARGRRYEQFSMATSMKEPHPVPASWKIYVGIDSGSGTDPNSTEEISSSQKKAKGTKLQGDPAAIVFVAVSPDYQQGRVIKAWRGDNELVTSADIVTKYLEMKGSLDVEMVVYDYADKDLHTIATRMGFAVERADKGRDRGDGILNTLFKHKILYLYREGDQLKLATELTSLKVTSSKHAADHLTDALRYVCVKIPWDLTFLDRIAVAAVKAAEEAAEDRPLTEAELLELQFKQRRGLDDRGQEEYGVEQELEEWADLYSG